MMLGGPSVSRPWELAKLRGDLRQAHHDSTVRLRLTAIFPQV